MIDWDAIVIGAGHNGLIAACYLAMAGKRTLVVERREIVGGACVTEEVWPGYHVSTGAYLCSLLLPDVVRDLDLERHGFSVYRRETAGYAPFPDGRTLTLYADAERTRHALERFCVETPNDVEAFFRFEVDVSRAAEIIEPFMTSTITPIAPSSPQSWGSETGRLALRNEVDAGVNARNPTPNFGAVRLGAPTAAEVKRAFEDVGEEALYEEFVTGSVRSLLDRRFASEPLKAVLATDGLIGTYGGPSTPGTAYVLLHHYLGRILGSRGAWGYVRGGMGSITQALAAALREAGGTIRTSASVKHLLTEEITEEIITEGEETTAETVRKISGEVIAETEYGKGSRRVTGVELANGERLYAHVVVSNADPYQTFYSFLNNGESEENPGGESSRAGKSAEESPHKEKTKVVPPSWQRLKTCGGASVKINLAVARLPQFGIAEGRHDARDSERAAEAEDAHHQHLGTVHLCPDMDYLERAWEEARNGYPSTAPMIEMYMQTATDSTLAPSNGHMVSLFVQYFPYHLAPCLDLETERARFAERVFAIVERYAPGFTQSILHQQILTPRDLEARFGLTGGHIFHGDLLPPNLWDQRSGTNGAFTSLKGLYLCGSGAHPGGCVYGAPGVNAAHAVLAGDMPR